MAESSSSANASPPAVASSPARRRTPVDGTNGYQIPKLPPHITVDNLFMMYNEGERPTPNLWQSPDEWEKSEAAQALCGLATSSGSDDEDETPSPSFKGDKRLREEGEDSTSHKRTKSMESKKKQSPWHPRAKLVFLACVIYIPPQDRGTIMFLGKACGRNELVARILGIACKKPWGRKQISSHSQTLKQKNLAPPEIQDLLTTTDVQRGKMKTTGAGNQGPILNFPFHPDLRKLMGFKPEDNLNYAPTGDKAYLYQYIKNPNGKVEDSKPKRAYRRSSDDSASMSTPSSARPRASPLVPLSNGYSAKGQAALFTGSQLEAPRPRTSEGLAPSRSQSFTPSPYSRPNDLKRSPEALGLQLLSPRPYLGRMKTSLSAESLGHSRDISEVSELVESHTPRFWSKTLPHEASRGQMLPLPKPMRNRPTGLSDLERYHHVG